MVRGRLSASPRWIRSDPPCPRTSTADIFVRQKVSDRSGSTRICLFPRVIVPMILLSQLHNIERAHTVIVPGCSMLIVPSSFCSQLLILLLEIGSAECFMSFSLLSHHFIDFINFIKISICTHGHDSGIQMKKFSLVAHIGEWRLLDMYGVRKP